MAHGAPLLEHQDTVDIEVILRGALPPIVAALALVSLGGARLLPLAVGIGLYAAYCLLNREWLPWPHELWAEPAGKQWLVWGIAAAAFVALQEHLRMLPARAARHVSVSVAAVAIWLSLDKVAQNWSFVEVAGYVGGGAIVTGSTVLVMRRGLSQVGGSVAPAILFAVLFTMDALLMVNGGSALLAQLCGAVAAAIGAAAATVLWRRGFALKPADAAWLGLAHAVFVIQAVLVSDLSWPAAGLALAAPFGLLPMRQSFAAQHPWGWFLVGVGSVLGPVGYALWLSWPEASTSGY